MKMANDLLKPNGYLVMTVDLFINLKPFCSRESNQFGTNVSIRALVEEVPFHWFTVTARNCGDTRNSTWTR